MKMPPSLIPRIQLLVSNYFKGKKLNISELAKELAKEALPELPMYYGNSRDLLKEEAVEMVELKKVYGYSVKELCSRINVSRSTFYRRLKEPLKIRGKNETND